MFIWIAPVGVGALVAAYLLSGIAGGAGVGIAIFLLAAFAFGRAAVGPAVIGIVVVLGITIAADGILSSDDHSDESQAALRSARLEALTARNQATKANRRTADLRQTVKQLEDELSGARKKIRRLERRRTLLERSLRRARR
jgi:hypothetical protein